MHTCNRLQASGSSLRKTAKQSHALYKNNLTLPNDTQYSYDKNIIYKMRNNIQKKKKLYLSTKTFFYHLSELTFIRILNNIDNNVTDEINE